MAPVTVLVVDDNAVVRQGLRGLLEASAEIHVVGEAWDGDHGVQLARALLPDVVLLDVRMPRRDGVSAAREIASLSRVLMTTFTDDVQVIKDAVEAGAVGYLVHGSFEAEDLVRGILAVARGAAIFSPEALLALRAAPVVEPQQAIDPGRVLGLTERQAEIMAMIAAGRANRDIANACFLSEKTVKNHINRIFAALGVQSRSEAMALWFNVKQAG